ncbi:GMC family oxidoreductase [Sneathiella sp. HT1-7]|uniref:GMC family oxidoreductase n=1 Tax=Sneathiella sp. HT1-7 TaxID=2887192 RepID=UPI001D146D6B|nr:GMC family oxidoreductase N-terminal domain-containing protein [Sneathiella sp. HT1-7]MCC3306393.1 GMC family oxidoreductase N-terminal domain-containing protein [Sneathiella sp. HT1-7]
MANSNNPAVYGEFDIVIVGAGSAGCVLANRLSADADTRVLLIEAGGSDNRFWIHVPVGYLYCMGNPKTDWCYKTEPEEGLNGRSLAYPRGKVLGGCSSINGMIYMRGQARDYDIWRQQGNIGWGWDDLLPYFKKSEHHYGAADEFHGTDGELLVEKQRLAWPALDAVREAAEELDIARTDDFNSGDNEGSGYFPVNQKKGIRWNARKAFIDPVRNRSNLTILKNAQVEKLIFEGKRVVGLEFRRNNVVEQVTARKEVILSAGSIGTPQILQLSGIGPSQVLKDKSIPVIHELKGVGENLQDHLQIRTIFGIEGAATLNERSNSLFGKLSIAAEYFLKQSGPMAMAPSQLGIFTKSSDEYDTANIEYHVQPLSLDAFGEPLHKFPAITVSVCNLRPESRGTCHIRSNDPSDFPVIKPNYLSTVTDRNVAVDSILHARKLMATKRMTEFSPVELKPGADICTAEELAKAAGDISTTIFHPVGTAKMGNDENAVVDDQLRVHGVGGLRIVDASIMPTITSGNTHAPVTMIAEKAADLIALTR